MSSVKPSRYLPHLIPGDSFEKFIDRHIRPPKDFQDYMSTAVDKVVRHLHQLSSHNSYKHYNIKEIVKSGSLGKGTCHGKTADVDLVVFFNGYKDMESFLKDKPTILEDIKWYMCGTEPEAWRWFGWFRSSNRPEWIESITFVKIDVYHVKFTVQMKYNKRLVTVNIDILPTIDVIYMHSLLFSDGINSVHKEIGDKDSKVQGHYSVCFCKRQIQLYDEGMAKVKDLIRLLKYWRTVNRLENLKSYCCEVLALWVYRNRLNENKSFKMADGFKETLDILTEITSDVVPTDAGMSNEYLDCFKDPANPYSSTIPYERISEIRKCAYNTLHSAESIKEDKGMVGSAPYDSVKFQSRLALVIARSGRQFFTGDSHRPTK